MLEINKKAAVKFGINTKLIENKTDTQRNIDRGIKVCQLITN